LNERANQLHPLRTLHLFAGAGGGLLGDLLLGHQPVCAVEIDTYCQQVLHQRQQDGILPWFPIFDDVRTFDGNPWRGLVDVVCGGFPCQDISATNPNATGIAGPKSGLWKQMARVIREIRPPFVLVENSPMLVARGLGAVLGDFSQMGYDAKWGVFSGAQIGAEHLRERIFILAYSHGAQCCRGELSRGSKTQYTPIVRSRWGKDKPGVDRMVNGMAAQMDRLAAIGNGQIPGVVKLAWRTLSETP